MSAYRLSNKAESDIAGILIYTTDTWGEEQAERYLTGLADCFDLIVQTPGMGRACDALYPGLRRIEQGKHIVFYRAEGKSVVISRVLHQRQLPQRQEFTEM